MPDTTPIARLVEIMAQLRDPQTGCQWDLQQSFDTIAPYTIEEAFEVAEAIAERDYRELCEELGDLLLQVVFHSRMAEEQGLFDFGQVVQILNDKLVRRHPHVFGNQTADSVDDISVDEIKVAWEQIKATERAGKGRQHQSALDGVPAGLPALQRAGKLQKKAARVGFDWSEASEVLPQLRSEVEELAEAMSSGNPDHVEEELGDTLFTVVNLARHLRKDPDLALRRASDKFSRRFRLMEDLAEQRQQSLAELDTQQLEALWGGAKASMPVS